jgi:putative DNA primase/helicase
MEMMMKDQRKKVPNTTAKPKSRGKASTKVSAKLASEQPTATAAAPAGTRSDHHPGWTRQSDRQPRGDADPNGSPALIGTEDAAGDQADVRRLADEGEHEHDDGTTSPIGLAPTLDEDPDANDGTAPDGQHEQQAADFEGEPWPEPVDGLGLLDDLVAHVRRHVALSEDEAIAVALWAVHTHALDAFQISPRLAITSPAHDCGKSTLLGVLNGTVRLPDMIVDPTAAGLREAVGRGRTLLLDEHDLVSTQQEKALRVILNSGHSRSSARIVRQGATYATWSAAAIARIGALPETLASRSVHVRLNRAIPEDEIKSLTSDGIARLYNLGAMAARFAADHMAELRAADPVLPASLRNRVGDNWRPLTAIGDAVGGGWPDRVRRVAVNMSVRARASGETAGIQLIGDIVAIFDGEKAIRFSSAGLARGLAGLEGRPWAEWTGRAINAGDIARILDPFGIHPGNLRIHKRVVRGYERRQFNDAFRRYVVVPEAAQGRRGGQQG